MNTATYMNNIISKFGGDNKHELRLMLIKLINMVEKINYELSQCEIAESQQRQEQIKENDKFEKHDESIRYFICNDIEETIKNIEKSNKKDYDKVLLIIDALKMFGDYYPIELIPTDYFFDIFNMYEEKKFGVEFDEKRDYQYVKVNKSN